MKEIVKYNIINYELIKIRQNTPILEYLKRNNFSFLCTYYPAFSYRSLLSVLAVEWGIDSWSILKSHSTLLPFPCYICFRNGLQLPNDLFWQVTLIPTSYPAPYEPVKVGFRNHLLFNCQCTVFHIHIWRLFGEKFSPRIWNF